MNEFKKIDLLADIQIADGLVSGLFGQPSGRADDQTNRAIKMLCEVLKTIVEQAND